MLPQMGGGRKVTPGSGLKLRISKKGEYGLAALIYIASKPVGRRSFRDEIARHCGIPKNYLARILCRLKDAGILGAVRGANGGYFLKGSPGALALADLLEALEGPICFYRCSAPVPGECPKFWSCSARGALEMIQHSSREWLQGIKLSDLLPAQQLRIHVEARQPANLVS